MSAATTPTARRSPAWSDTAIAELLDVVRCPVCAAGIVSEQRCPSCGADFAGAVGRDLWEASRTAADALRIRQAVLDLVPRAAAANGAAAPGPAGGATAGGAAAPGPAGGASAAGAATPSAAPPSAATPSAATVPEPTPSGPAGAFPPPAPVTPAPSATVQSVLAVAGAGLVAIAAVVFTFFNPDLTDPLPRAGVVGVIALAFLGGAALLARRRLRFSAESIGALGAVFTALTVAAVLPLLPEAANQWVFAALATLACGGLLAVLGSRAGIRSWLWSGVLALAFVPLMLALGGGSALAATAGCLASAAAASALIALAGRGGAGAPRTAEQVTLTVAQFGFTAAALVTVWWADAAPVPTAWLASAAFVAVAATGIVSARHPAGAVWTAVAGAAVVGSVVVLPLASATAMPAGAWLAAFPTAAGLGLVVLGVLSRLDRALARHPLRDGALFSGAVAAVAVVAVPVTLFAFLTLVGTLAGSASTEAVAPDGAGLGLTVGLAALALALASFAAITASTLGLRHDAAGGAASGTAPGTCSITPAAAGTTPGQVGAALGETAVAPLGTRWLAFLGAWYAVLAFLTVLCVPGLEVWARIAIGLVAAIVAAAVVSSGMRDASAAARMPLVAGAHAAVVLAAVQSWHDAGLTVGAGIAVVAAVVVLSLTVPRRARFVHAGSGFAYALLVLATALSRGGADEIVVVCATTCAAGAVAIAATLARRVPRREWYAVLAVTAVPFVIGVVQVVFERSGWTALSTAVILCLALTLVTTTRTGLGIAVRTLAATTLVPAAAVVIVCVGAQVLPTSGSPVVLPVIAALVAGVLATADRSGHALETRLPQSQARAARAAVEASTLVTAAIAVALSLLRSSAGLPTALLVLVILGAGFAATAVLSPRRYAWPLAGVAFTGALWCAWGIAGVTGLEPYLLPPALGAAVVGAVLTARGRRAVGLYTAGLAIAVVPVLCAPALDGTSAGLALGAATPGRAAGLVAAAWALVAASVFVTRASAPRVRRLRALRGPTLALAIVAATAAAVQGVRWGVGLDPAPTDPAIVAALLFGLVGAGAAASAGRMLRLQARAGSSVAATRWLGAPAVLIVGVATWPSIERDWVVVWTMWALLLGLLTFMLAVAARGLRGPTGLPPVWFLFAVSFVTAVVAWSPRDLRVEWFSLPLGLFLLAAGGLALRRGASGVPRPTLTDWPAGWTGSWPLLAPGLVTMLSASVVATYTDPLTWRAILVMAIALIAILVGATRQLAAPFLIGIVVLPVENVLAFAVQIGRGIEAMPWWITLSVVGAVLLIIAVGYERRAGEGTGLVARLRDLA